MKLVALLFWWTSKVIRAPRRYKIGEVIFDWWIPLGNFISFWDALDFISLSCWWMISFNNQVCLFNCQRSIQWISKCYQNSHLFSKTPFRHNFGFIRCKRGINKNTSTIITWIVIMGLQINFAIRILISLLNPFLAGWVITKHQNIKKTNLRNLNHKRVATWRLLSKSLPIHF